MDNNLSKADRLLINKFNSNLNAVLPILKGFNSRIAAERKKELPSKYITVAEVRELTIWNNEEIRRARINKKIQGKKEGRFYVYDQSTIPWHVLKPHLRPNYSIEYLLHGRKI